MPGRLVVAAAQFEAVPGDVRLNLARAVELVESAAASGASLVVLPELLTTGYHLLGPLAELAEPLDGPSVGVLAEAARRRGVHVVGGIAERTEGGALHDTAVLVGPGGLLGAYRKAHLWGPEASVFTPGDDPPVVDAGGALGRVGLLVCYDLEFPETVDVARLGGATLVAAPAASSNELLWRRVLTDRARELGIPLVAANLVGRQEDQDLCGHSMVIGPDGGVLADAGQAPGLALAEVEVDAAGTGPRGEGPGRDVRIIHPEVG